MITIDKKKCIDCGACVDVCPALVIESIDGAAVPVHMKSCIKCYHCVAACPVDAVRCDEFALGEFKLLSGVKSQPTPAAVRNMMASRRSVREFKDKDVPRELIEELLACAAIAPTGHNAQAVRLNVITDRKLMDKLDTRIMKLFQGLVSVVANPVGDTVLKSLAASKMAETFAEQKEALARFGNAEGIKKLQVFRGAPVLVVAHCGHEAMSGKDDCAIALSNMAFLAQAHGLGSTWIGYLVGAAKVDPTLKRPLGVPLAHSINSALILGWPKYKYKRSIPRKPITVKWIGE